jgi:transcription factor AP-2 gamma
MNFQSLGDRQDASSNGNPRIPHLSSAGQHLYSPAPPLSHPGVAEYQPPPYFPPPTSSWLIRSRRSPTRTCEKLKPPPSTLCTSRRPLAASSRPGPAARARRGPACPHTTGTRPACCRTSPGWSGAP